MKICYWGTYDDAYPRNLTVIAGLRKNGAAVTECRETLWKSTGDKLARASSGWLAPALLLRWFLIYLRLSYRFLRSEKPDFIFVGYSGHFDMFPAALLARLRGVPVVFDAFLSLYEAFVVDRPAIKSGSLKARILYLVDKYSCSLADVVLMDTDSHIDYFRSTFGLRRTKFVRSFIGASEDRFFPRPAGRDAGPFTVLHFGRYIPLHGLKYIVRAAKLLESRADIRFLLIGSGEELRPTLDLAKQLRLERAEFLEFVKPEELVKHIAAADVCLGIFGDTEKALRVIPNKVFEALAMAKPVITGASPASAELLTDGKDCVLCGMASAEALAAAVLRLKNDSALAARVSEGGYRLFRERASAEVLGGELLALLEPPQK